VGAFLDRARAAGAHVVYSLATTGSVLPELAPWEGEPSVSTRADKFYATDLDEILRSRGVTTVVIVGVSANGAVLYTTFGANLRGYTVVVAEDGISADDPFAVLATRYQVLNQPGLNNPDNTPLMEGRATLSRTDLITFR
jgi:nicotinamidase-related amidase